jgi:adenosylhomocysteine nucleosidase
MTTPRMLHDIPLDDILFVFALEDEAGSAFAGCNVLFTGIGKVNAAITLTKALQCRRPRLIVNLGRAANVTARAKWCVATASYSATWT